MALDLMKQGTVGSRLDPGNRQARVGLGDVQHRLGLHVQKRRILGRVCDLENPLAPISGEQSEVLIPLAVQRVSGRRYVEGPLCERFGFLGRKRRGLCLEDRFGFGSGTRLDSGVVGMASISQRLEA